MSDFVEIDCVYMSSLEVSAGEMVRICEMVLIHLKNEKESSRNSRDIIKKCETEIDIYHQLKSDFENA